MKKCITCGRIKELVKYYKHPETADGYMTKCKDCQKLNSRTTRSKEQDKVRYKKNPKKRMQLIFRGIKNRCTNPKDNHYKRYGARGIKNNRESFEDFYEDMKDSYIDHYVAHCDKARNTQIDRIDNDGDYCKVNCRRVTAKENIRNSRRYRV